MINSKNWIIILLIISILLGGLFLYQKTRTQTFKNKYIEEKKEKDRIKNNYNASLSELKNTEEENGDLVGEIGGYKITIDELKNEYNDLFKLYKLEKNKPPKYITETKYIIKEKINEIITEVEGDSIIKMNDSISYGNGNWRTFNSSIPFKIIHKIKEDSINSFYLNKALKYAFELQQKGIYTARVVVYDGNDKINFNNINNNSDSLNFRVQLIESVNDITIDEISRRFDIKKNLLSKTFDGEQFVYMAGVFIPNKEIIINNNELDVYSILKTFKSKTEINISMRLTTSIYEDVNNDLKIKVMTDYPGITFTELKGAEIIPTIENNRKLSNKFKKQWSIGIHVGYGGLILPGESIKTGPVISVGLNYNPKFFQFGSSGVGKNTILDIIK